MILINYIIIFSIVQKNKKTFEGNLKFLRHIFTSFYLKKGDNTVKRTWHPHNMMFPSLNTLNTVNSFRLNFVQESPLKWIEHLSNSKIRSSNFCFFIGLSRYFNFYLENMNYNHVEYHTIGIMKNRCKNTIQVAIVSLS